jgi:hypothetical protein
MLAAVQPHVNVVRHNAGDVRQRRVAVPIATVPLCQSSFLFLFLHYIHGRRFVQP